jgi:hypothetical protein
MITKNKNLLAGLILAGCAAVLSSPTLVATRAADEDVATWVSDQVKSLQPTASEKRFDEIGWVRSIVQAEKLAHQHNRPVFLFTFNGNIDTGRC